PWTHRAICILQSTTVGASGESEEMASLPRSRAVAVFPNSALPTAMEGQQPAPTWVCRSRWPWMAPAACTSLMRVSSVTGLTGSARSRLTESLPLLPEADLLDIPGTADRPSVHPLTDRGGSLSIRLATSTWRITVTTSSACFGQALFPRVETLLGFLPVHG